YCPAAVRIAHKFAMINPNIKADMIESYEFTEMADKYNVQGVPRVVINETVSFEGALPEGDYLKKIKEAL
ncbi:MAG: thioredoxin family protein, partial [bacterium]